ncbi:MAG: T9SS type A sorting domain-containing protein [Candidatus Methylacidiphilales bacterium]
MKNIIILLISLLLCNNIYSQKYFSKLFDVNNEWEILNECSFDEQKNLILLGQSVNFFVNDSSKLGKIFILKLDNNYTVIDKIDIRESDQKYTLGTFVKNLKNKIVYGKSDTTGKDLYGSYFLSTVNNKFKISNIVQLKFYPNTFRTNGDAYYINNKLYFFCADYTTFVASKLKLSMHCMDTNGNLLWGKIFQDKRCYTNNVVQTKDGNFLLAGLKYYGEGSGGDDSAFAWFAKVDTLGNILWEQVLNRGSDLMCEYVWATNANGNIYLTGTNYANYPSSWYRTVYGDSSFSYMLKINENNGKIEWQKRFLYSINQTRGLMSSMGGMTYYNGSLYSLIRHNLTNTSNQYVMFAKFDLEGNMIWKRLFQQGDYSNRAYSLTPIDDGFLICGDAKDSTKAKGDSDAWLIKTDSNGCIIPGCNAKDNVVQIINPEKVFTVYPNPAQNEINVNTENLDIKIESLAIYNMQGQLFKFRQAQLPEKEITKINTEDLANGNYLLIITTNKQQMAGKKFVVER